jgi:DNA-binding transcriptional ArsR family regulator
MDETDIDILVALMDTPNLTATDIARKLYSPPNTGQLRKKDSFIRYRLGSLEALGLVRKRKGITHTTYMVPLEDMTKGTVSIKVNGCEEMELGEGILIPGQECNRLILIP